MHTLLLVLCGAAAVLAVLAVLGRTLQALGTRRDRRRFGPLGESVAVDGRRVHVVRLDRRDGGARAAGPAPTVVFEAALGGSSLSWILVQPEVARFAPTLSYDRAGMGTSDAGAMPRTLERGVADLQATLRAAGAAPPYVLVGHSYGGLLVRLYAALFPDEVCALVLVDAPAAAQWAYPNAADAQRLAVGARLARRGAWAARWGIARLVAGLAVVGAVPAARSAALLVSGGRLGAGAEAVFTPALRVPAHLRPRMRAAWLQPKFFAALGSQMETLVAGARAVESAGIRADLPLAVLTAANPSPERLAEQERLLALCRRGCHRIAASGGHWIPLEHPQLVVAAVRDVLAEAAAGSASPPA